jgi:branched-chain amino acid transport system ATP-binding protein
MREPILRLRDISLSFKGIKALSNLSFEVNAGEICALIGPNDAGKSSLLNVICGVYRADDGEISFAGEPLSGARPLMVARRGISRTFQHNALFKHLSVIDNVMAGLTRQGVHQHSRTHVQPAARSRRGAGFSQARPDGPQSARNCAARRGDRRDFTVRRSETGRFRPRVGECAEAPSSR